MSAMRSAERPSEPQANGLTELLGRLFINQQKEYDCHNRSYPPGSVNAEIQADLFILKHSVLIGCLSPETRDVQYCKDRIGFHGIAERSKSFSNF